MSETTSPRRRRKLRFVTRAALVRLAVLFLVLGGALWWLIHFMTAMPGVSYQGPLAPLSESRSALEGRLRAHVEKLAGEIGERNTTKSDALARAADYIDGELTAAGLQVTRQSFKADGVNCQNLIVEIRGAKRPDEIIVVGGHYDSARHCPGANDNGTGTAATIELARVFARKRPARTLRFVAFVNEEPPHFQRATMGSAVYARSCKKRGDDIVAMLSLETIGYYTDEPNSQSFPTGLARFFPSTGNFIAFVGNLASRDLVNRCIGVFRDPERNPVPFPSEGAALPGIVPQAGFSDQWSFWQQGYPGIMVTDTANFRYEQYHTGQDLPGRVVFDHFARVVAGLEPVIDALVETGDPADASR